MNHAAQMNGFGQSVAPPRVAPQRTIPFDYAFRFDLEGKPGKVQNSGLEVSVEATFTAVSIGYGVVPKANPITFGLPAPPPVSGPILLASSSTLLFSATLVRSSRDACNSARGGGEVFTGNSDRRLRRYCKDGLRLNPEFAEAHFTHRRN